MSLVTAIIPTLAETKRAASLKKAVTSLHGAVSSIEDLDIIIVINGDRYTQHTISMLEMMDVELVYVPQASSPEAIKEGRKRVVSEYFCFLDDDDVYLPMAIDMRRHILANNDDLDLVVTNGYRAKNKIVMKYLNEVNNDPLRALFKENWLASCGGLFRSSSITEEYFASPHPYLEWTWLAYILCMANKTVGVLDVPTFCINDTPGSTSKSEEYLLSHISLFQRMIKYGPRDDIAKIIRNCTSNSWHSISEYYRENKEFKNAWYAHIMSMLGINGFKYISYTRRLLVDSFGIHSVCI